MIEKNAYLIGFCSLPFEKQQQFIDQQIVGHLFTKYKNNLIKYSPPDERDFGNLYKPQIYYMWGKYDICTIAAVDDFEFATRFFRPFNPIDSIPTDNVDHLQNFNYKVVIGIHPDTTIPTESHHKQLPYIAVCQLKINSAFLIGNGMQFVEPLKEYIKSKICSKTATDIHVEYKICESFSYHEIILVLTSNSIYQLRDIVLKIRGSKFSDLAGYLNNQKLSNELIKDSILECLLDSKEDKKKLKRPSKLQNHIFESTLTSFGWDFRLFNPKSEYTDAVEAPLPAEQITFFSKWNIKPGHLTKANKVIANFNKAALLRARANSIPVQKFADELYMVTGKGDVLIKKHITIQPPGHADNRLLDFPELIFKANSEMNEHIIDCFTSIHIGPRRKSLPIVDSDFNDQYHLNLHKLLTKFTIKKKVITTLWERMNTLWVPKVLAAKVLRLISNFNNAVLNPDMYAFYIELYPFIKTSLLGTVENYYKNKGKIQAATFFQKLHQSCEALEVGFQNRFYQSYWTSDVPEVNTDYTGGLHNLITSYDSGYKSMSNSFCRDEDTSFVYVKSDNRAMAMYSALQINYMHLTQPLNFCSVAAHECCNWVIDRWFQDNKRPPYNEEKGFENIIVKYDKMLGLLAQADLPLRTPIIRADIVEEISKTRKSLFDEHNDSWKQLHKVEPYLTTRVMLFINTEQFRYFIVDRITYQYAFRKDYELFSRVHWNYMLQSGHIITKAKEIHPQYFVQMTFRMALIHISHNRGKLMSRETFFKIVPELPVLSNLRATFLSDIYLLLKKMFAVKDYRDWFIGWESILRDKKNPVIPDLGEINEKFVRKIEDYLKSSDPEDNYTWEIILKEIRLSFKTQSSKKFKGEGTIESKSEKIPALYIMLFLTYLRTNVTSIQLLERNSNGIPKINAGQNTRLTDFFGGTFVAGKTARINQLIQTVKFMRLMHHLSQLQKKIYIKKILAEKESTASS